MSTGLTLLLASENSDSLTVAATRARSKKRLLMSLRCWCCELASAYAKNASNRIKSSVAAMNAGRSRVAAASAARLRIVRGLRLAVPWDTVRGVPAASGYSECTDASRLACRVQTRRNERIGREHPVGAPAEGARGKAAEHQGPGRGRFAGHPQDDRRRAQGESTEAAAREEAAAPLARRRIPTDVHPRRVRMSRCGPRRTLRPWNRTSRRLLARATQRRSLRDWSIRSGASSAPSTAAAPLVRRLTRLQP